MLATIMAGVILIIMGFAKFGSMIKFIPYPVVVGFTSGIAVVIFSSQVNDFLGLNIPKVPADFFEKWAEYLKHLSNINYEAMFVGLFSFADNNSLAQGVKENTRINCSYIAGNCDCSSIPLKCRNYRIQIRSIKFLNSRTFNSLI